MSYLRNIAYALQKILTIANDPNLLDHIELCPGWADYSVYITELKERLARTSEKPLAAPEGEVKPVCPLNDSFSLFFYYCISPCHRSNFILSFSFLFVGVFSVNFYQATAEAEIPVNFEDLDESSLDDMLATFTDK